MNKDLFVQMISEKIKLIRVEKDYTQDKMAEVLGISKKTLVQMEKGRISVGWTNAVAICALFRNSEVLNNTFGGSPLEILETIAHDVIDQPKEKTLGGKVWWTDIDVRGSFRLQQNHISRHFRIIDENDHRRFSTFDEEEAKQKLKSYLL